MSRTNDIPQSYYLINIIACKPKRGVNLSSLFIVGNGFDMAHGFKTSFNQFKKWLCDEYGTDVSEETIEIPEFQTNYKRLHQYNSQKMAIFFYNLIYHILGDDWNDFESALPTLNWEESIEASVEELKYAGDFEPQDLIHIAEDFASQLSDMAFILKDDLFRSWAQQINIKKPNKLSNQLKSIIETNECYFLNFNYTDTIELHYNVKNVCHIHGRATTNDGLIVGHAGQHKGSSEEEDDSKFYMMHTYGYINAICEQYKKDTKHAFLNHLSFFKSLTNITDIYVHGFSFSHVDIYYLEKLIQFINSKKTIFHLHSYHKKDWSIYRTKLLELGAQIDNVVPFRFVELFDTE